MSTETVKPTAAFPVKKLVMLLLTIAVFLFFLVCSKVILRSDT